jgi:quinol monooxygenase YgiN
VVYYEQPHKSILPWFRRDGKMFITLYSYRAKSGKSEAVASLYGEWQRLLQNFLCVSTELFCNAQDPADVLMLARFKDESAAWAAVESAGYRAWYSQLARLAETGPIVSQYQTY